MIEVGLAVTGDPSVVQQLDRMSGEVLLKAQGGASLALGSLRPAPGALRLLNHVGKHRASQPEFLTRVVTPALAAAVVLALRAGASLALRTFGGAGKADDRVRDQSDRGQVAGNEPLAAGLAAGVVVQPNRSLPRVRFHHFPYRPGRSWPATGAPELNRPRADARPATTGAQGAPLRDAEPHGAVDGRQPIVGLAIRGLSPPWHCKSALGGAPEGRPARMQSRGERRATTIGVIQMSPMQSCRSRGRNGERAVVRTRAAWRGVVGLNSQSSPRVGPWR